jgi:hypothetical protein
VAPGVVDSVEARSALLRMVELVCGSHAAAWLEQNPGRRSLYLRHLAGKVGVSNERIAAVYYGRRTVKRDTLQQWGERCGYRG